MLRPSLLVLLALLAPAAWSETPAAAPWTVEQTSGRVELRAGPMQPWLTLHAGASVPAAATLRIASGGRVRLHGPDGWIEAGSDCILELAPAGRGVVQRSGTAVYEVQTLPGRGGESFRLRTPFLSLAAREVLFVVSVEPDEGALSLFRGEGDLEYGLQPGRMHLTSGETVRVDGARKLYRSHESEPSRAVVRTTRSHLASLKQALGFGRPPAPAPAAPPPEDVARQPSG